MLKSKKGLMILFYTVRPCGTGPHGTRTWLGQNFKKGSKIFSISDFGTWTLQGYDFKKAISENWHYWLKSCATER